MTPSLTGTLYCLPVRLSVIVSVSAISEFVREKYQSGFQLGTGVGLVVRRWCRVTSYAVVPFDPPCQVLVSAPLTTERPKTFIQGVSTAYDAQQRFPHPSILINKSVTALARGFRLCRWRPDAVAGRYCSVSDWLGCLTSSAETMKMTSSVIGNTVLDPSTVMSKGPVWPSSGVFPLQAIKKRVRAVTHAYRNEV